MHLQCKIPRPFYKLKLALNLLSANTHTNTDTRQLLCPSHVTRDNYCIPRMLHVARDNS